MLVCYGPHCARLLVKLIIITIILSELIYPLVVRYQGNEAYKAEMLVIEGILDENISGNRLYSKAERDHLGNHGAGVSERTGGNLWIVLPYDEVPSLENIRKDGDNR